jgi:hypothetical protein
MAARFGGVARQLLLSTRAGGYSPLPRRFGKAFAKRLLSKISPTGQQDTREVAGIVDTHAEANVSNDYQEACKSYTGRAPQVND